MLKNSAVSAKELVNIPRALANNASPARIPSAPSNTRIFLLPDGTRSLTPKWFVKSAHKKMTLTEHASPLAATASDTQAM